MLLSEKKRRGIEKEIAEYKSIIKELRKEGIVPDNTEIHYRYAPSENSPVGYVEELSEDLSGLISIERSSIGESKKNIDAAAKIARRNSIRDCLDEIIQKTPFPLGSKNLIIIQSDNIILSGQKKETKISKKCINCSSGCKKYVNNFTIQAKAIMKYTVQSS